MNFIPFLMLLYLVIVFVRTENNEYDGGMYFPTPLEEANITRFWFNCDDNKEEGFEKKMSAINNCIKQIDASSIIANLTKNCYPGMQFPVTAKEARTWHCERSEEEIVDSIECENSAIKDMDSDESSEGSISIRMCVWESMPDDECLEEDSDEDDSDEDDSDEDDSDEDDSEEDDSYEDDSDEEDSDENDSDVENSDEDE